MRGTAVFFLFFFFFHFSLSPEKKKRKEKKFNPLKGNKMGGTNAMFSESSPISNNHTNLSGETCQSPKKASAAQFSFSIQIWPMGFI